MSSERFSLKSREINDNNSTINSSSNSISKSKHQRQKVEHDLLELLRLFPEENIDQQALCLLKQATEEHTQQNLSRTDKAVFWSFGGDSEFVENSAQWIPAERKWMLYLETLRRYSQVSSNVDNLIKANCVEILRQVIDIWNDNVQFMAVTGHIIANLARYESARPIIFQKGFIDIAKEWTTNETTLLKCVGIRILRNMDAFDELGESLMDGLYLFHPETREKNKNIKADIIFLHGIRGGPFKTWRQISKSKDSKEEFTNCWPKAWLSKDIPFTRILCLDYDAYFTDWYTPCPVAKERRLLKARSLKMLHRLKEAGVGDRPIIWVAHSMGGILVKQILKESAIDNNYRPLLKNTIGIVFYSVPHKGSPIATHSAQARYILFPSVELNELQRDGTTFVIRCRCGSNFLSIHKHQLLTSSLALAKKLCSNLNYCCCYIDNLIDIT